MFLLPPSLVFCAVLHMSSLPTLPHPWVFALAWAGSVVGIGFAIQKFSPERIARCCVVIACSFMLYLYLFLLPALETYRTQKPFAEAVKERLGPDVQHVALFHHEIVFYLGQANPLTEYFSEAELMEAIRDRKVRWLIVRRRDWQKSLGGSSAGDPHGKREASLGER